MDRAARPQGAELSLRPLDLLFRPRSEVHHPAAQLATARPLGIAPMTTLMTKPHSLATAHHAATQLATVSDHDDGIISFIITHYH